MVGIFMIFLGFTLMIAFTLKDFLVGVLAAGMAMVAGLFLIGWVTGDWDADYRKEHS